MNLRHCFFLFTFSTGLALTAFSQGSQRMGKAIAQCLSHGKVSPYLHTANLNGQEVIPVLKNDFTPEELQVTVQGKDLKVLLATDLFFHGIENYVILNDRRFEKGELTLVFTSPVNFTCVYLLEKGKTKRTFFGR